MAKCVYTLNDVVYTIGGAKDQQAKETVNEVIASMMNPVTNKTDSIKKANMLISRSSFGCTINPTKNEIFVAGGYSNG